MIQNAQAKSDAYTVLAVDNVWTAEFAANRYIVELPQDQFPVGRVARRRSSTRRSTRTSSTRSRYASDGGMLYYRTDLLQAAGIAAARRRGRDDRRLQEDPGDAAGQGRRLLRRPVPEVRGPDGQRRRGHQQRWRRDHRRRGKPNVDTPEAKAGLDFLVDGFKEGYIPKEALTYKEEEARRAFQEGKLIFHAQWPYLYTLANKTTARPRSRASSRSPRCPGWTAPASRSLGGHAAGDLRVRQEQEDRGGLHQLLHREGANTTQLRAGHRWRRSTRRSTTTRRCRSKFPYLPTLKESILSAVPRPKVVRYGDATLAIQDAAYGAMSGDDDDRRRPWQQLQAKLEQLDRSARSDGSSGGGGPGLARRPPPGRSVMAVTEAPVRAPAAEGEEVHSTDGPGPARGPAR